MVEVEGYEGDLILNLLRHATLVTPAAQHFWISLSARYAKQLHAACLQYTTNYKLAGSKMFQARFCFQPDSGMLHSATRRVTVARN